MRVALARIVSPQHQNLFSGAKGKQLENVAPHLFRCDETAVIAHMTLVGEEPDEVGVLIDSSDEFLALRKHLRRFLTVRRERDGKRVYFRYYDPRVLRVFLPICTPLELRQFFGPIEAFHCQGEVPGSVLSFQRDRLGLLTVEQTTCDQFLQTRYGVSLPATQAPSYSS